MRDNPAFYLASRISSSRLARSLAGLVTQLHASRSAAVAPLTALLLIPISGALAFAVELGSWQYMQRSMQNAADSAAIAAATVDSGLATTGTTSEMEGRAAAAEFGYVNSLATPVVVENTKLTAGLTCPSGTPANATCYRVTIISQFPLLFSRVLGFTGSGGGVQQIVSSAVAINQGASGLLDNLCAVALSSGANAFDSNGGPKPDMAGCTLFSNGGMTCSGHDLGAAYGVAVGTSSGCGQTQVSGSKPFVDPYKDLATANIPANPCGTTYHQLAGSGNSYTVHSDNQFQGTQTWTAPKTFCGDVQLTGDVTLDADETVMVIRNGRLDLNGHTLKTADGKAATIVFSGDNSSSYYHYPTSTSGGGILDIKAPSDSSSSPWKNIAIYQDPAITKNTGFTYTGNDPTWQITGVVYLPQADVRFSGIVNKDSDGTACFSLIAYTIRIDGTAQIFANDGCESSGIVLPTTTAPIRTRLVR